MKFKVGDTVRTLDDENGTLFPVGTVGVIGEVDVQDDNYKVIADGDFWWYAETELERCDAKEEKTYEQGLADAWELAKKICHEPKKGGFSNEELSEIFGTVIVERILERFTAEEALAMVTGYENHIKIAPNKVVEDIEGTRALVLDDCGNDVFSVLTENGCVESWHREGCAVVSGKTIDVSELVKQIGERKNGAQ